MFGFSLTSTYDVYHYVSVFQDVQNEKSMWATNFSDYLAQLPPPATPLPTSLVYKVEIVNAGGKVVKKSQKKNTPKDNS